ncbi:phage holin [Streptococcus salivarius]|uniref:phage holin n=1 Tax=Streptococcus salivarius TaxID=1304 RepID=UPI00321B16A6
MKINWSIRFNAKNKAFLYRVALAIALPILTYFGINFQDLTSWDAVFSLFGKFVSNPYLVGLTIVNILNIIPDPTTKGLSDSERALSYNKPYED